MRRKQSLGQAQMTFNDKNLFHRPKLPSLGLNDYGQLPHRFKAA